VKQPIGPDKVMRGTALFCLLGTGVELIYLARHRVNEPKLGAQMFGTATYLFFAFILFGLFYGQYIWIPSLLKRRLNLKLGFVQAFFCLALLLFGLFPLWIADLGASGKFNPDDIAVTIAILGEALFIVNVCWTLLQPASTDEPLTAPAGKAVAPLQAQLQHVSPLQALKKARFDY